MDDRPARRLALLISIGWPLAALILGFLLTAVAIVAWPVLGPLIARNPVVFANVMLSAALLAAFIGSGIASIGYRRRTNLASGQSRTHQALRSVASDAQAGVFFAGTLGVGFGLAFGVA